MARNRHFGSRKVHRAANLRVHFFAAAEFLGGCVFLPDGRFAPTPVQRGKSPEPSVIKKRDRTSTGKYAPPATHIPMMAAICGNAHGTYHSVCCGKHATEIVGVRETHPPAEGKKNARRIDQVNRGDVDSRWRYSGARITFFAVMGKKRTGPSRWASLAIIMNVRPRKHEPPPVIVPAEGAPAPLFVHFGRRRKRPAQKIALSPINQFWQFVRGAVSRPFLCLRLNGFRAPPPC